MRRIKIGIALLLMAGLLVIVQTRADVAADDFVLVTGVLDQFGRLSESDNFKVKICSGGQPTPVGESEAASSNYKILPGYANSAAVLHGDCNADGLITLGDVNCLINYLWYSGPPPIPMEAGDVNCNGSIDVGDVNYLINYLWRNGPPPCGDPNL